MGVHVDRRCTARRWKQCLAVSVIGSLRHMHKQACITSSPLQQHSTYAPAINYAVIYALQIKCMCVDGRPQHHDPDHGSAAVRAKSDAAKNPHQHGDDKTTCWTAAYRGSDVVRRIASFIMARPAAAIRVGQQAAALSVLERWLPHLAQASRGRGRGARAAAFLSPREGCLRAALTLRVKAAAAARVVCFGTPCGARPSCRHSASAGTPPPRSLAATAPPHPAVPAPDCALRWRGEVEDGVDMWALCVSEPH